MVALLYEQETPKPNITLDTYFDKQFGECLCDHKFRKASIPYWFPQLFDFDVVKKDK